MNNLRKIKFLLTNIIDGKPFYTNIDKIINLLPSDSKFRCGMIEYSRNLKKWGRFNSKERRQRRNQKTNFGQHLLSLYVHDGLKDKKVELLDWSNCQLIELEKAKKSYEKSKAYLVEKLKNSKNEYDKYVDIRYSLAWEIQNCIDEIRSIDKHINTI